MIASSSVKSAQRTLDIIELLATVPDGLTLTALAHQLNLPKSSVHGLVHTLRQRGYISHDETSRTFHLGLRLWEISRAFNLHDELVRQALPIMQRLVDEFDEIVQLAVRDGIYNVYLAKVDCRQPIRLISQVGVRLYCHATGLGKALLSTETDDEIERLYAGTTLPRFTPNTITDLAALKEELRRTRARGYAEDREEYMPGLRCVAVPVVLHTDQTLAAMSMSLLAQRATDEKLTRSAARLRAAAAELADRLARPDGTPAPDELAHDRPGWFGRNGRRSHADHQG